jgi:hypothetical protein
MKHENCKSRKTLAPQEEQTPSGDGVCSFLSDPQNKTSHPWLTRKPKMIEKPRLALHLAGAMLAYVTLLSPPASAGGPLHHLFGCPVPDCIGKWCPDDYCSKKEPCVCIPLCFGCDDYCSKKPPCVCAPLCFGCDDYCKKCPPKACSGPLCQFLRCGSSRQPCGCAACAETACNASLVRSAEPEERLETDGDDPLADAPLPAKPQPIPPVIVRASDFKLTK